MLDDTDEDLESLYTEDEVADAVAETARLLEPVAFRKGYDAGRREARAEWGTQLKALSECNGSTEAVVAFLCKAHWDEEQHKRNHGQFSATEGGKGDGVSETGSGKHGGSADGRSVPVPAGAGTSLVASADSDRRATSLAARIADVPAHVASRIRSWVQAKYERLSARYGPTGAKAILGGMVLLLPAPVPGSSLLPVAIAEAVLRIRRAVGAALGKAMGAALTPEHVQALARDLLHELYEAEGEPLDPPGDDAGDTDDDTDLHTPDEKELLAAAVEYAEQCLADGTDPEEGLHRLAGLYGGGETVEKAWESSAHPRGKDGRFLPKGEIEAAKSDPTKAAALRERVKPEDAHKLEAALEGKTDLRNARETKKDETHANRQRVQASRTEAKRLAYKLLNGGGEPGEYAALIPHLSALTGKELSHVRLMLGASFGGERGVEARRQKLLDYARGKQLDAAADGSVQSREAMLSEPGPGPADSGALSAAETHAERMRNWEADRPGSAAAEAARDRAEQRLGNAKVDAAPSGEGVVGASKLPEAEKPKEEVKPAAPKQPWEMSRGEYVANKKGQKVERGAKGNRFFNRGGQLEQDHYNEVARAFQLGKPVPPEVVSEYRSRLANDGFRIALEEWDKAHATPPTGSSQTDLARPTPPGDTATPTQPGGKDVGTPAGQSPPDIVRGAIAEAIRRGDRKDALGRHNIHVAELRQALESAGVKDRTAQDEAILEATHRDQSKRGKGHLTQLARDLKNPDAKKLAGAEIAGVGHDTLSHVQIPDAHSGDWTQAPTATQSQADLAAEITAKRQARERAGKVSEHEAPSEEEFAAASKPASPPAAEVPPQPKTKKGRDAIATQLQGEWRAARENLAKHHGTREINDKLTPEQNKAESQLLEALEVLSSGRERDGTMDLGPVSDARYAGYQKVAQNALATLRQPSAGATPTEAAKPKPPVVSPLDVYNRSGTTAKYSEVNAAARAIAAMSPKEAAEFAKQAGFNLKKNAKQFMLSELINRSGSRNRSLLTKKEIAEHNAKYNDEPALTPADAMAQAKPTEAAKPKSPAPREVKKPPKGKPAPKSDSQVDAAHTELDRALNDRTVSVAAFREAFKQFESLPRESLAELATRAGYPSLASEPKGKLLEKLRQNLESVKIGQYRADAITDAPGASTPKGKPAPKPVPPESLTKQPGADKATLQAFAAAAPSEAARETILDAEHNTRGAHVDMDPHDRRRQTVERLAAAWRDAHDRGDTEGAQYAEKVLAHFGASLHGPKPGEVADFSGRHYDSEHSVLSGPVKVLRQPVVLRGKDAGGDYEHVAVKGKAGPT